MAATVEPEALEGGNYSGIFQEVEGERQEQAGVVRRQAALNSGVTNVRMQQIRQAGTVQDTLLVVTPAGFKAA